MAGKGRRRERSPLARPPLDDEGDSEAEEGIMDLKRSAEADESVDSDGDSEDSEEDSDEDDEDLPEHLRGALKDGGSWNRKDDDDDGDSDDDDEDEETGDLASWGRSKRAYYSGDTADLEIGQEFEEAEEEEREVTRLQREANAKLDSGDFDLSEEDEEDRTLKVGTGKGKRTKQAGAPVGLPDGLASLVPGGAGGEVETIEVAKDVSHLSKRERLQLVLSDSPELPGLLKDLLHHLDALEAQVDRLAEAVSVDLGASDDGIKYLQLKRQLLLGFVSNMCFYLLLKAKGEPVRGHPVVGKLLEMSELISKLGVVDQALGKQMDLLCSALSEGIDLAASSKTDPTSDGGTAEEEDVSNAEAGTRGMEDENEDENGADLADDSPDDDALDEEEARFVQGLSVKLAKRNQSDGSAKDRVRSKRKRRVMNDFADDEDEDAVKMSKKSAAWGAKKMPENPSADRDDDEGDDSGDDLFNMPFGLNGKQSRWEDKEGDGDDDEEGMYEAAAAAKAEKKAKRVSKYAPQLQAVGTLETELQKELAKKSAGGTSKRGVSQTIMKNRGLTPHKNKLNRNPRVKKKEAFRKAVIRRKGQVRDVRVGEAASYGGEATGIRSVVVRSKKLR